VEWKLSDAALSKHDPTRPIDWVTPRRTQAVSNSSALYSLPWKLS
jgi:hypothetical protein